MKKLTNWVKDHQVISFFVLAFLITWGLGFSYGAVVRQGKFLMAPLLFAATCGPALAGIIITVITGKWQKSEGHRLKAWIVFLLAWIASIAIFLANFVFVNKATVSWMLVGIVIISVIPVAFILNLTYSRFPVIRNFPVIPVRMRKNIWWTLLALILIPALCLFSITLSQLAGRSSHSFSGLPATGIALIGWISIKFVYQFFFFNGTGEEAGWRGFALPRLQRHVSPLVAALLLSLIWVPWHVFLWQAEGRPITTLSFWLMSYMIHIPASVIICWIFNRSRGSILVAGICHAAANTITAMFGNLDSTTFALVLYAFVVVIVIADRMWHKLPVDHPAVHKGSLLINAAPN